MFNTYLFEKMEDLGVIKNYDKSPHVGKGRKPLGNLSVNVAQICTMKADANPDVKLWGLVGYAAFVSGGEFGKKSINDLNDFVAGMQDSQKVREAIIKAAKTLNQEFTTRFKKNE